jgi:hypothetical protein
MAMIPDDTAPGRALAVAVIECALSQAQRGKPDAIAWFSRCDSNFTLWCMALDLEPEHVSERVLNLLANSAESK